MEDELTPRKGNIMGMNYYWYAEKPCPACGRSPEPIHIGKSSAGWCFSLRIHREHDIENLKDWIEIWSQPEGEIRDEEDRVVSPTEMEDIVTNRSWSNKSHDKFADDGHSEPGPNGLLRHKIAGSHCVGHGEGTWDLIEGEFS